MSISRAIFGILAVAAFAAAVFSQNAAPAASEPASDYDWMYILRGVFFIFASAIAMVWLGRRWQRRSHK